MSGLEIFQVFASAVTVAKLASRTIQILRNAGQGDNHIQDIRQRIRGLHQVVETVQEFVGHRKDMQRGEDVSSFEVMIWKHLETSLKASENLLEDFDNIVKATNHPNPGAIQTGIIRIQLEWNRNEREQFERSLGAHVQAIHLWITSLQAFSSDKNHREVIGLLESIRRVVMQGKQQLALRQNAGNPHLTQNIKIASDVAFPGGFKSNASLSLSFDRDSDLATIVEYVGVGESVLGKLDHARRSLRGHPLGDGTESPESVEELSYSDSVLQFNESAEPSSKDRTAGGPSIPSVSELSMRPPELAQPERTNCNELATEFPPNFGPAPIFRTPLDHLEKLIRAAGETVSSLEEKGDYNAALQEHNRKIEWLKEREEVYGKPADWGEMMEKSARFLIWLERFDEAVRVLKRLIDDAEIRHPEEAVVLNMASYYYLMGTAYLERYLSAANRDRALLTAAKQYAGYAFSAHYRLFKDHPTAEDLVHSAELCVRIHEEMKETTAADEYRKYIPKLYAQPSPTPSLNPLNSEVSSYDGLSNRKSSASSFNVYDNWDDKGRTFLIRSIQDRDRRLLRECLQGGADIHLKSKSGTPPIIYAANSDPDIFKILLERGARIDDVDAKGFTALHRAISRGKHEVMQLLIQNNAKVDFKDCKGLTPLMRAVQKNNVHAVEILINRAANLEERTSDGWRAVHFVIETDAAEVIQLLQTAGADIDARCKGGKTPLHYACEAGARQCAETLIDLGADFTILDEGERSPLCLAVVEGKDELVRVLLRHGVTPDPSIHPKAWRRYEAEFAKIQGSRNVGVGTTNTRHSSKFSSFPTFSRRRFSSHRSAYQS